MKDENAVMELGGRRELFLDDGFVAKMFEGVSRRLHHPVAEGLVMQSDAPYVRRRQ